MDTLQKKKRCANITTEQRMLLIEYVKKHPQLLKGKFSTSFTLKDSICLWQDITDILNAVNGANKDWKGWRKCWHDLQSRSKKKQSEIRRSMAATGGGQQSAVTLTSQEEQILDVMCPTSIYGHPDIEESSVNILEELEDDPMEVEYLEEYDEDISSNIVLSTYSGSNQCSKAVCERKKVVAGNDTNDLSHEKENIEKIQYIDVNQPCKVGKAVQNSGITLNANSCGQDKTQKKIKITTKKTLQNTLEVSAKLNDIYDKTYDLKKNYYKKKIHYMKRSVKAKEKIANSLANCNMS